MTRLALPLLSLLVLAGCASSSLPLSSSDAGSSSVAGDSRAALVVANNSSKTIFYLYASSCSNSSWGPDRLDSDQVLSPSETESFVMTPGCWDLKAVFGDDTEVVRRNANISNSSWRWTIG